MAIHANRPSASTEDPQMLTYSATGLNPAPLNLASFLIALFPVPQRSEREVFLWHKIARRRGAEHAGN